MKTQSIFKLLIAGALVGTFTLTSCESRDHNKDSNSETTEGDVNDPTKYNSGSNTSTRTGGSMGLNEQEHEGTSKQMSENQRRETGTRQGGGNTTTNQTSSTSGLNTSSDETDLGGTSSTTQNITKNPGARTKNTSGTTGGTGRASGVQR